MKKIITEYLPSSELMMNWTQTIFDQGIRRPGYPADKWTENWIKEEFENYGLKDIKLEPIPVKKWTSRNANLQVWLKNNPEDKKDVPCFPIPYTLPTEGIEAELQSISEQEPITGKIAVDNLSLFQFPVKMLKSLLGRNRFYDPDNEFKTLNQMVPFDMRFQGIFDTLIEKNPLGFIGILSFPWETDKYYVPYDAVERKLPSVWVSRNSGKIITNLMEKATVIARISYSGGVLNDVSHNITGVLPGNSDDWVVIGSHHDGPWNSAVEDASGITLVLAQAYYWSQIPKENRPFNLMFLLTSAHMAGAAGASSFVKMKKHFLDDVIVAIHLEHVARDVKSENDHLIPLESPTVRWWFVSRIQLLEDITEDAIIKEDLKRSIFPPIDGFIPGTDKPPTDGAFYHPAGIPLISFLSAPPYLFDAADTLDKIHKESFEPLTRAVIRIINSLSQHSAEELRSQVLTRKERNRIMRKKYRENVS